MQRLPGDPLGTHRVIAPKGALPQSAERLDASDAITYESEIVVDVETLNIDAASFQQMMHATGADAAAIGTLVEQTVRQRGKQHNPLTGLGGMLLGTVSSVGDLAAERGFKPGDRVATLASLTLTPLAVEGISAVRIASTQVDVVGKAFVFFSAPLGRIPSDFPDRLALAVLDVAGAAPQVARLAHGGDTVVILGAGGKSGLLAAAQARRSVGRSGRVIGIEVSEQGAHELQTLGYCNAVDVCDARDPISIQAAVLSRTDNRGADLTVSCVNVANAELGAILGTRDRGTVCFFAMSTSFTAAALGAEGASRDVDLVIGNGFARGHAAHTLDLVRGDRSLFQLLSTRYT